MSKTDLDKIGKPEEKDKEEEKDEYADDFTSEDLSVSDSSADK